MSLHYPTRTFFTSKRLVDDKPILLRQAEDKIVRSQRSKEMCNLKSRSMVFFQILNHAVCLVLLLSETFSSE